ncbi:hypothetical protein BJX63DRAFT_393287 [Aspergillus granulosus]|uniref:Uncharacterized protein n=1 Tax=Aspergillus granulosus TaxID=176169 RepID=A0ABR4HET4_9EURO
MRYGRGEELRSLQVPWGLNPTPRLNPGPRKILIENGGFKGSEIAPTTISEKSLCQDTISLRLFSRQKDKGPTLRRYTPNDKCSSPSEASRRSYGCSRGETWLASGKWGCIVRLPRYIRLGSVGVEISVTEAGAVTMRSSELASESRSTTHPTY